MAAKGEDEELVDATISMLVFMDKKMPPSWPFHDAIGTLVRDLRGSKCSSNEPDWNALISVAVLCSNRVATMPEMSPQTVREMIDLARVPTDYELVSVDIHDGKYKGTHSQLLVLKHHYSHFGKGNHVSFHSNMFMKHFAEKEMTESTIPRYTLEEIRRVSPLFGHCLKKAAFEGKHGPVWELVLVPSRGKCALIGAKCSVGLDGVVFGDENGRVLNVFREVEVPYNF